jgi:hypothetical protein
MAIKGSQVAFAHTHGDELCSISRPTFRYKSDSNRSSCHSLLLIRVKEINQKSTKMKFVLFVGLLALFSGASQAQTMPLDQAVRELMAEFRIVFTAMISDWNNNALFDTASCNTVHDLVDTFPPAWAVIAANPGYVTLLNTLGSVNVLAEWNTFIQTSLQPAFGFIQTLRTHTCAGTRGGNAQLVTEIRATFTGRRPNISATLDRLMAASADFAALMGRIAAEQAQFTAVRCSAEMLAVGRIYRSAGFDVDGVAQIIGGVFGWTQILPC